MKKLNLIERLLSYSHEKQKVRGMQKYCILLLLLFACVTHAWAETVLFFQDNIGMGGRYAYFYSGTYWDTNNGAGSNSNVVVSQCNGMTKLGSNGSKDIYVYQINDNCSKVAVMQNSQQNYGSFWDTQGCAATQPTNSAEYDGYWSAANPMMIPNTSSSYTKNGGHVTYYHFTWGVPTVWLKHANWDGNNWGWKQMTYNDDGTFSLDANYTSGNGCDRNCTNDGSGATYMESPTKTPNETWNHLARFKMTFSGGTINLSVTKLCIVTFDMNGHGSAIAAKNVLYNTKTTAPSAPSATGYTFGGWYTDEGCTSEFDFANTNLTVDITLYAKWTPKTYNITYKDQGDVAFSGVHEEGYPTTHTYGTATDLDSPTKDGYTFGGWYTNSTCTTSAGSSIGATSKTADFTLYAKWTENMSDVSLVASPEGKGSFTIGGAAATSTTAGVTTTRSVTAVPISGYHFVSWAITGGASISSTSTNPTTVTGGGAGTAATLTATFAADAVNYTITYGVGTGYTSYGSVSEEHSYASGSSQASGTEISLSASPATHYKLEGWYTNAACTAAVVGAGTNNPYEFTLGANTAVYAKFVLKQCTISLNRNGGDAGAANVTASHGSTLPSFTAHTRTGYTLKGYYTDPSTGTKIINADGSLVASTSYADASNQWDNDATTLTLYAQWTANEYAVTFNKQSGSGGDNSVTATFGAAMPSVTVPTRTGYDFNGYYGSTGGSGTKYYNSDGSSANPWDVANATTIYAYWTAHNYTITYSPSSAPTGCSYNTKPTSCAYGNTATIVITPLTGYTVSVSARDASSNVVTLSNPSANTYTFTQPASNVTITVTTTEIKSTVTVNANQTSMGTLKFGETSKSWGTTASVGVTTSQSIKATASSGYIFSRWILSGGAATSSSLTSGTITLKGSGTGADGIAKAVFGKKYYYRGGKNSWGATQMTCHESGYYAYYNATSGEHEFKITPNSDNYTGACNTFDNSYGNITLTNVDDGYGGQNVKSPGATDHYIMIFYPNTAVNSESYPVIAAGTELYDPSKAYLTLTTPSTSTTSLYCANNPMTIGASASNLDGKTSLTYSYEYSEDKSSWNTITPTSSTSDGGTASCVWTTPNVAANKTYYVRAKLTYTYEAATVSVYSKASAAIKVTGTSVTTKTIKVKKPSDWDSFEGIHIWSSGDGDFNTSWPGFSIIVNHLGGAWYEFVIPSVCNNFVLNNGIEDGSSNPDKYQTVDLTYSGSIITGDCYVLDTKTDASNNDHSPQKTYKYNLTHVDDDYCPAAPTVSASAASSVTNTSATLNGRISDDGNDAITEYGFYWGTTSACANKQVVGTSFTPDNTYTYNLTGLTAGNTIYFKAFAKNGLGETVTTPATSFIVPYSVTITQPTGCSAITPGTSTQYVRVGDAITATASAGYSFSSWTTTNITMGSSSTVAGVTTSSITAISADEGTIEPVYTANNYTVTFDATTNGGTCATASKSVTFASAYGTLPDATHASRQFIGWYTTSEGAGSRVTAETIVSTSSDHTLYARFESTFEVTVTYKCGEDVLYPSNKVYASASSLAADISAPVILGYSFSGWTGSNVTFGNASSATTTVNASALTTITANYTAVPTVYFKNNLGWENVYVTFDAYFDGSRQNAPGSYGKPYFQMTQIGSSDIFYCEIPSTYTASNYASWANTIAFDNTGFDASANVGTKTGAFDSGEFIGRGDFDPRATMFIPYDGDTETRNGGTFYRTGCWIQYNTNYSGYKVRVNSKVSGSGGTETVAELRSDIAGSTEFTGTVNLTSANYTYGVMLYKDYLKNTSDIWYTNVNDEEHTITSATTSLPWAFIPCTDSWQRCRVHTESLGDYKFTVSFATGKPMVDIEYPVTVGDWKLVYKDLATWSGDAHTASWCHPSRVIKAKADAEDIVSFYVAYGSTPSIELHKCTAIDGGTGAQTWEKQGDDLDLSAITATGIYNFKVTQDGSKVATVTYDGEYEGNFYIRTDASDGGWSNYKASGTNTMTYSEYAKDNSNFTHYYMRFAEKGVNIKFVIANDYSECISDTLVSDTYTNEWIEAYANVRFMWNKGTNVVSRAYISGSSNVSDRFLVLEGDDKMYDENGNELTTGNGRIAGLNEYEMKFTDDQNWIYEATVKAQPGARIKLTAKYNTKIQYFYGKEGDRSEKTTELLLGGSGESLYKVRVVYDFKTNRLIKAFIPDAAIGADLEIDADLMIIRDHQSDAQQITFTEDGALSKVKTVYGALMFNKWTLNNKDRSSKESLSLTSYERDLFYISFPFDVKLNDVFGFGTYGKHWILEYYDGKGRAANGFWADSDPNWKFVMPSQRNSFTMKAFEGYILALDLDEMTESSEVWNNNVENVYLYFPSSAEVKDIEATNRLITIDQTGYECTINRPTPDGDRRVKDSYWHCIGVPSFANYNSTLYDIADVGTRTTIDWRSTSMPYLYEVNWSNNTLNVTTSSTFNFKATWSYLVQYAGATIYWSQVNVTPASIVARERKAPTNAEFRIELQKAGQKADQTFVRLTEDENVTNGFDFNYDLSKEFNKNQANIYTLVTTVKEGAASVTQSAANVLPMTEQTTVIPVGVKIAATGDYTFAIPEGTNGVGVTLIDNETGIQTPLSALDYTVNLSAGTYDERFVLVISPIMQTPTGIEQIGSDDANGARKMLIDGILYIVRDGKIFDAQGNRVK